MTFHQAADEKVKYRATVTGDTVSSASASISPAGPTLGSVAVATTTGTVLVSSLTLGKRYRLVLLLNLASGQIKSAECFIACP